MAAGSLQNKVAIITGAGRGIGAACAKVFEREGAKVVLASRSKNEINAVAAELGASALAVATDVSDEAAVLNLFDRAIEKFGKVDLLINNAGIFIGGGIKTLSAADWDTTININLRGTFLCAREAFRRMKAGGGIVNISSLAGIKSVEKFPNFSAYVAAKSGVVGFTEALAAEGDVLGIRVNCIAPGAVDTIMLKQALPHLTPEAMPEDIANIILSVCDDAKSGILNGAIIEVRTKVSN